MSSAQLRLLPNVHRSLSCCRAVRKPYVAVRAVKGVAVSSGRCLTPPAMFSASAGQRRLSHSFLGCLCGDASDSGTGVTASGDGRADDIDRRDQFALIVVNGELGEFLQPLWRHGETRPTYSAPAQHPRHALMRGTGRTEVRSGSAGRSSMHSVLTRSAACAVLCCVSGRSDLR